MKFSDDDEPISKEWLQSLSILCGDKDVDDFTVVISVDERTTIATVEEEVTVLGYSFKDNEAYVETYHCPEDRPCCVTTNLITLGVRKTRGEFRLLLRSLNAWDHETRACKKYRVVFDPTPRVEALHNGEWIVGAYCSTKEGAERSFEQLVKRYVESVNMTIEERRKSILR